MARHLKVKRLKAGEQRQLIGNAESAYELLRREVATAEQEMFFVIAIDVRNGLIGHEMVAMGTCSSVEVSPRDVFRSAIRHNAAGVVLAHNHPSGDPEPSADDIALTRRLVDVGRILGIPVIDHVVIGRHRFRSLAEQGAM